MANDTIKNLDDVLKKAAKEDASEARLQAMKEKRERKPTLAETGEAVGKTTGKIARGIGDKLDDIKVIADAMRWCSKKASELKQAFEGLYELPVIGFLFKYTGKFVGGAAKAYTKLWDSTVYKQDKGEYKHVWGKKFGILPWLNKETVREPSPEKKFSKKRAAALLISTFAAAASFTNTGLGEAIRFVTVEPVTDAISMSLTLRKETLYLNSTQEIDTARNSHQVRGTITEENRGTDDAIYLRVHHRLAHDVWNLAAHGKLNYVTDHVVAPIAPGNNKCEVTYYGYRLSSSWTSRLMRSLELYPTMLEAKCTTVASLAPHTATASPVVAIVP